MITFEIRRAGFINKGAQLMLLSIIHILRERYPSSRFVMSTTKSNSDQPFRNIVDYGIYPKASLNIKGYDLSWLFSTLPNGVLDRYGLVRSEDINVVIDAAGFAYGSQFGLKATQELLRAISTAKRNGSLFILLPQAFGPFDTEKFQRLIKNVCLQADLMIARDKISLMNLNNVVGSRSNVLYYPDFTNLLQGRVVEEHIHYKGRLCIVPNKRMIEKTSSTKEQYVDFLSTILSVAKKSGQKPFVLLHEDNDLEIASLLQEKHTDLPIVIEKDPLLIKGIIGNSSALIGSRFHALVSAMSQAVPSCGTGWSHKYQELFSDYKQSSNLLLSPNMQESSLTEILNIFFKNSNLETISKELQVSSNKLKLKSREMWSNVFSCIDNHIGS